MMINLFFFMASSVEKPFRRLLLLLSPPLFVENKSQWRSRSKIFARSAERAAVAVERGGVPFYGSKNYQLNRPYQIKADNGSQRRLCITRPPPPPSLYLTGIRRQMAIYKALYIHSLQILCIVYVYDTISDVDSLKFRKKKKNQMSRGVFYYVIIQPQSKISNFNIRRKMRTFQCEI